MISQGSTHYLTLTILCSNEGHIRRVKVVSGVTGNTILEVASFGWASTIRFVRSEISDAIADEIERMIMEKPCAI